MARQIPIPITELLGNNLPVALKNVSSILDPLFQQIRLIDSSLTDGVLSLAPDEDAAIREWFRSISDWLSSTVQALPSVLPIPPILQDAVAFEADARRLTLQLAALSDLETNLAGIQGLSFVANPDGFEAIATHTDSGVDVVLAPRFALRFQRNLFEPVRQVSSTGGQVRYEPDASRPFTDVDLGEVSLTVNTRDGVSISQDFNSQLPDPVRLVAASNLVIERGNFFLDLRGDRKCLALRWESTQLGNWLGQLAANFREEGPASVAVLTLRMELGDPLEAIRLDWRMEGSRRNYLLPGIKVTTPANTEFSMVLESNGADRLSRMLFILTLPRATNPTVQSLTAASNFAWSRGGDRELQNDSNPDASADADPLIRADFVPQNRVSLALLDWHFTRSGLPTFLKQVDGGLPELDFDRSETLSNKGAIALRSLAPNDWNVLPAFNTDAFDFPFLRNDQRDQRISINIGTPQLLLAETRILLEADARVMIGDLLLESGIDFTFNWETFALTVNHDGGLKLSSPEPELGPQQYLGLTWRFRGAEQPDGTFHHLTLVTKDYNYQIIQAEGATIELDYTLASDDPITFIVSNLAISDTGITLTAEVSDRPAKLNGLDTRFRFHGSRLEIIDNAIKDFTLAGSGPLPPDLVGEAVADIALQFSQQNGALTLVSGGATLRGDKLLKCQGTRFEFSIDAMGLKFVNDGKFHLYFTLTGSAQFLPLPTDDANGPLALLTGIKIQLVECPLTSDVSVIGQHVEFLIELPEKVSFSFLGCFEMEIRSIGFVPQFERFGGDAAMEIGGQVKFAQGTGDMNTVQINFHSLFIGLPAKGSFIPRLFMRELEVNISLGEAFSLHGVVEFRDEPTEQGFLGEGMLEIPGMPVFAASFAFLRVRRSDTEPWVRAWFIFLEARQISFYIPYVELYIREVGLGFGYRYTLASIRAADETADLGELIGRLRDLSRTQGDLSKRDRWSVDLEAPGEDLRWTIVLRALISQTSATPGSISLKWLEHIEKVLPCLFLFDAVIAFRSDLTFFMAVRAWINTNYYDYVNDVNSLRERPLFSGFVLLSVRQKRFLAQISSNPDGSLGTRPPLPVFVEQAIANGQFSATILIEPALLHAELGWPNMLRWGQKIGPLEAEVSGGMIFRVSKHNLVLGISYKARGALSFEAGLNLKIVGVRVSAHASFAWGARFIGVIDFADPVEKSALYAAIGLEIRIRVAIAIWIKLLFIKKTFRLSLEIGFTAGLELGIDGLTNPGLRGTGTLFISAMGRSFQVSVKLGLNEGAVQTALNRTSGFLNLGLEATDVDPAVPGVSGTSAPPRRIGSAPPSGAPQPLVAGSRMASAPPGAMPIARTAAFRIARDPVASPLSGAEVAGVFRQPGYDLFVIRPREADEWGYFVLIPRGETDTSIDSIEETGFLPPPPAQPENVTADFEIQFPSLDGFTLQHFSPITDDSWQDVTTMTWPWKVDWGAMIIAPEDTTEYDETGREIATDTQGMNLGDYLTYAFRTEDVNGRDVPESDPDAIATTQESLADERVQNPSEDAYEAAVRGALEQFRSSPYFKHDPNSPYEQTLEVAFRDNTSIYTSTGESASGETGEVDNQELLDEEQANQQAHQLRGIIVQDLIADLQDYAELPDAPDDTVPKDQAFVNASIAFQMGLVFRFKGNAPDWLTKVTDRTHRPTIAQRADRLQTTVRDYPDVESKPDIRTFNIQSAGFGSNPPQFEQVQVLTDTNTIAIAWDLKWRIPPEDGCSACQREPEHHLLHYQVRRRSLDGQEREEVYTLKPAEGVCFEAEFEITDAVIQRVRSLNIDPSSPNSFTDLQGQSFSGSDAIIAALFNAASSSTQSLIEQNRQAILKVALQEGGTLKRLRPRFPLVDHFTTETLDDQAAMPVTGRSYLYSITPIDLTKTPGRPLTLVATRYPSEPPRVPVNGEFKVEYRLDNLVDNGAIALDPDHPVMPEIVLPSGISVRWDEPAALREGPTVPVEVYRLVFRKDTTLPIGSYGLDSSTQGSRSKTLPTSNARTLPTDITIRLAPANANRTTTMALVDVPGVDGLQEIPLLEALQQSGILPTGSPAFWKPEAWQIFFQTESINQVPSALAPVKVLLDFKTERGLEERQPAQLEWIPKPLQLPLLPPEDARIISGLTHVPIPDPQNAQFNGTLDGVGYRLHPENLRLLRFRWNQGPSNQPGYPLSLNAGYTLLELDVDANTTEVFEDVARLRDALRDIQQVQLLPASDLTLTPDDTLAANQWEAWYPSRSLRSRRGSPQPIEGSQRDQGPWYSWRESQLVWPRWPTLTDASQREEALHPFLQILVETLDENLNGYVNAANEPLQTYNVDLQFGPPRTPGDFKAFRDLTAPKADPYGWSILLRLGLSVVLTLRDETTNELVTGSVLLQALNTALNAIRNDTRAAFSAWFPHLYVELLFQPGQSFSPEASSTSSPDSLLAMVQISLRPLVIPYLSYGMVEIKGDAGATVEIEVSQYELTLVSLSSGAALPQAGKNSVTIARTTNENDVPPSYRVRIIDGGNFTVADQQNVSINSDLAQLLNTAFQDITSVNTQTKNAILRGIRESVGYTPPSIPCTVINQAAIAEGQQDLAPNDQPAKLSFRLPLNGYTRLLFRYPTGQAPQVTLIPSDDPEAKSVTVSSFTEFTPLDERSTYFTVPSGLAADFAGANSLHRRQWQQIKLYLESINSTDPTLPAIELPTDETAIAQLLPDFLTWTQRFFDASENVMARAENPDLGPWLVTAYPRISTPAYASPDASGRLKYDHLLTDRWAHNYRYYIRPGSRYELLWQSLLQSPSLFSLSDDDTRQMVRELDTYVLSARSLSDLRDKLPDEILGAIAPLKNQTYPGISRFLEAIAQVIGNVTASQRTTLLAAVETFREVLPDPQAGGIDVTIERTQPIDKPLILRSGRLDAASTPGNPAPPGRTWEVMVAQHPEQLLMERNQTLVRRLAYRQIAFTLLRRFAFAEWIGQLKEESSYTVDLNLIQDDYPSSPRNYPEHPDHLEWNALSPADVRSLDLPLRNGNFQQGTLVLQWDALPFFYEYKLLLVAQSASTVSEPNELVQQDFEYRSPVPEAEVSSIEIDWTPPAIPSDSTATTDALASPLTSIRIRTRRVDIPLKRFWDALTTDVQQQWDSEEPDPKDSTLAKRKLSSLPDRDVIYQIVELFSGNVEVQTEYLFDGAVEQFATRQLGERFIGNLEGLLPPTAHPTAPGPQADYVLETLLHQVSELQLKRSGYFTRVSPNSEIYVIHAGDTEPKIIRRMAPSLFLIGVFGRGDRTNLLINSIPDLRTLSQFPGTTAALGTKEEFLDEWYATRQVSATPVLAPDLTTPVTVEVDGTNESVTLPNTVDYPEVPTPNTIPQALRGKLTIRHDAVIWNGTILSDEKTALNTYRQQRPDYQAPIKTAIRGVLDELQSVEVTTPFDVPERRPHPVAPPTIGTYSFDLNFPSQSNNGNWVLRWTGPMSQAEEDTLTQHAQAYGTDYGNGVMALITAVQDEEHQRTETEVIESQGSRPIAPPIPSIPNEISRKFSIDSDSELETFPTFALTVTYTLTWRGSMTDDEAELLRRTYENSSALRNAVNELSDDVVSDSRRNNTFTEAISFAWPRLDQLTPARREDTLGNRLRGLAVDEANDRLRWTGADNLDESVDAIINRVRNRLNPGNPFILAFETLIRQLDRPYTSPVRLQLLRVRAVLSEPEKQALAAKFRNFGAIAPDTQTPVALLLDDIDDRTVITQLYESGFSQEPISTATSIPASLQEVVDFPDPAETVLVWTGAVSPEERQAALALTGDDAFTAALDAMTRLRPDGSSLPESIRNQLQITVDPETEQEQLTWVFPAPTNDQIRVLQSLTADEGYESSLRRLITALLNETGTPEQVSVLLVPLPELQSRSIFLPGPSSSRPRTENLPPILNGKLLIGNAVIRYHGLMTVDEGAQLRSLYDHPSDQAAIERLFEASTQQGLRGRELRVRSRRGSAAPSELISLTPKSLPSTEPTG